ncbi:protein FAR1-RELATED SEQUENCE [Citrus sinensis]|nr:protein FAR1-RELATED SEQUENCE [Citrus sinensis]
MMSASRASWRKRLKKRTNTAFKLVVSMLLSIINQNSKEAEFDIPSSHDILSTDRATILPSVDDSSCSIFFNGKHLQQLTSEDVIGSQFETLIDAENFYSNYSKVMGFSIRKNDIRYDNDGQTNVRLWVFERKDRIREPRTVTRVKCPVAFRVKMNKKVGTWVVNQFIPEHSHELAMNYEIKFLRSHRSVKDCDMAQATAMKTVGIKTSQIMDFLVNQAGGYDNVGFTLEDLYNSLDIERRSMMLETDSESALAYLKGKADMDPNFFCKYTVDEENRLSNLFWADSISRLDYHHFGDVLAFDSTYKTNEYGKPLVMLVGVNNHYATCFFGCALLVDETVETYMWVLETFLSAMNNKKPISVVTDGDRAMRKAIKKVIPEARHRLCVWHLQRNAQSNGHFFADMCTTQRCEGMNAYMNRFLQQKLKLQINPNQSPTTVKMVHSRLLAKFQSLCAPSPIDTESRSVELSVKTHFKKKI